MSIRISDTSFIKATVSDLSHILGKVGLVSYIQPSVGEAQYTQPAATDLLLVSESLNRVVIEALSPVETLITFNVNKANNDNYTANDLVQLRISKSAQDTYSVVDYPVLLSISKTILDYISIDDQVGINKSFTGTKNNTALVLDQLRVTIALGVSEIMSAQDNKALAFGSRIEDNAAIGDTVLITFIYGDSSLFNELLFNDVTFG